MNKKQKLQKIEEDLKIKQNIHEILSDVTSPQDLIDTILKNGDLFIKNADRDKERVDCKFKKLIINPLYGSTTIGITWDNHLSNSHCAPIGHKTNWAQRDKNEPTGYPGWRAYITFELSQDIGILIHVFKDTSINTGTGGGGTYELSLFAQDFKKMAYCELLSDFEQNKLIDPTRVLYILDISHEYVDMKSDIFNRMLEDCYKKNPDSAPQLLEKILALQIPDKQKSENAKKIKL